MFHERKNQFSVDLFVINMGNTMKSLSHLRRYLAVGLVFGLFEQGNAEENCEISSPQINQAIEAFNATERGAEYCAARTSVKETLINTNHTDCA